MKAPAVFVNVITPFSADGSVDLVALQSILSGLIASGIGVLLTNGGPGEGHSLTLPEFRLIYEAAIDECAGRIPVHAVIPEQHGAAATIECARVAATSGIEVIHINLLQGPHLMKPSKEELAAYFDAVINAVDGPVALAANPGFGYLPAAAAIAEICRKHERIVAVRFGNVPDTYILELQALLDRPISLQVLVPGSMDLIAAGADALYGIEANIIPRTFRHYADAIASEDIAESTRSYAELRRLDAFGKSWNPHGAKWLKMAVKALGLPGTEGGLREPYLMPPPADLEHFAKGLLNLGIREIEQIANRA